MHSGMLLRRSIGSFALTCEGTGNRILLRGQELGVMTSSNYWTTSTLNAQLCLDVHWPEQINPRVRQHAAEMNLIPVRMKTWLAADAQPLNPLDPPAISRLSAIHAPALIMAGALDHPEVLRAADVMADEIKGAKKHIFSHSAHVPNMEEPEVFTQVVLSFLDGLK